MRWIVILCIALVLSALAVYKNQERPATRDLTATTTPETPVLYQDGILGFNVTYQQQDELKTTDFEGFLPITAAPVVAFQLPADLFTGTNLAEVGVYIGASSSPDVLAKCAKPSKNFGEISSGTTTLNGVVWNIFNSTGVGAGNIYDQKTYRTLRGNTCFEMTELLHSGNIDNYPQGTVIEFDKAKFQGLLESIAQTFTFTK